MKEFYFGESKPPFFPPPKVYTTPADLLKAVAEALGGYVEEWHTGRWCLIAPKEQPAPQEEKCPTCNDTGTEVIKSWDSGDIFKHYKPCSKCFPQEEDKTFCPQCGFGIDIDEDGCCKYCGATAIGKAVSELTVPPKKVGPRSDDVVAWREVEK